MICPRGKAYRRFADAFLLRGIAAAEHDSLGTRRVSSQLECWGILQFRLP